ncbi:START-like domain-containing protein [Nafulsella turpanensis]|uniref:START-like domain-containing protein n=1 Tax=Nafulsella turpanensis TaxID=1265690 RepID=UPI00034B965D|nr:START-like domain-containing protein [Nafulsella turpanensis]
MSKIKFENEYEMRASQKILYPYLNTASGLAQWFADDVTIDEDKIFHFFWDEEEQKARLASKRREQFVRFEYLPSPDNGQEGAEEDSDQSYFEFTLEKSEITQSVFLRVVDYSDIDDEDELHDIWEGMISNLREMVGG